MSEQLPAVRRGETFPWSALCRPPDGYRFLWDDRRIASDRPLGIVALRDHDERPRMPEEYLTRIEERPDHQAAMLGSAEGQ